MDRGIRKTSAVITVAAPATPETLFIRSASGQVPRSVILRKIFAYSNVGAAVVLIGTGLAPLVPMIPSIAVMNTVNTNFDEDEIPGVEVAGNLTVQSSVLGVQVQVEVEEVE